MISEAPPARQRLGPYELLRRLARGGMANVFLARRGGAHVALKVLDKSRIADGEAYSMFLDEARLVQMLDHGNVAAVLDVDVLDDEIYLAMEYIHGVDLRELLGACMKRGAMIPYEVAIAVIAAAAAGLDHAHHRRGPDGAPLHLVHRDVSLSNIMVGHDGGVKVVDFGIATSALASVHTMPGIVRGKASYMSPEQCLGDKIDCRADVFALGVVLYELTTGARCFSGKTDFDRMLAVVRSEFIPPSVIVKDYPRELEQLIVATLSTDPARRPASAGALIAALDDLARRHGWTGGRGAIARLMRTCYGDVPEPWLADGDDAVATLDDTAAPHVAEVHDTVRSEPLQLLEKAPRTRLARGSQSDLTPRPQKHDDHDDHDGHDDHDDHDDDEPTSRRAALRRRTRTMPGYSPVFS
ncbi:MAG: serine/threonine protein kinase [Deltaproteobacteria bacterium]|nr:serine/threonine protein kinase [Deltaproteobacteria bacterium]